MCKIAKPRIFFKNGQWNYFLEDQSKHLSCITVKYFVRMLNEKKISFANKNIIEKKYGKPHIVFIEGYWRVSPWKRGTGSLYYETHAFVRRLNYKQRSIA